MAIYEILHELLKKDSKLAIDIPQKVNRSRRLQAVVKDSGCKSFLHQLYYMRGHYTGTDLDKMLTIKVSKHDFNSPQTYYRCANKLSSMGIIYIHYRKNLITVNPNYFNLSTKQCDAVNEELANWFASNRVERASATYLDVQASLPEDAALRPVKLSKA